MIDLTQEEFSVKEIVLFNEGKAGIATGVKVSVERKTAEDKETAPDYKVVFTDSNGGSVNKPFWYMKPEEEADGKKMRIVGQQMSHIWKATGVASEDIPKFANAKELLDKTMAQLRSKQQLKANVAVDYGNVTYPKAFLEVKYFPPFMELDVDETKLFLSKNAQTTSVRPSEDDDIFSLKDSGDDGLSW